MASRPIFVPWPVGHRLVKEIAFEFQWNSGFAVVQKQKNIKALHFAASEQGYNPLLEVSTKSEDPLGVKLSAFNLSVPHSSLGLIPLESAFQGSKIFESGGPYTDLYSKESREARRDDRVRNSGDLIDFCYDNVHFPAKPMTAFYDWLYIKSLISDGGTFRALDEYDGFTDIEFNPKKSVNCQARSCAIYVALKKHGLLAEAMESTEKFISVVLEDSRCQPHSRNRFDSDDQMYC